MTSLSCLDGHKNCRLQEEQFWSLHKPQQLVEVEAFFLLASVLRAASPRSLRSAPASEPGRLRGGETIALNRPFHPSKDRARADPPEAVHSPAPSSRLGRSAARKTRGAARKPKDWAPADPQKLCKKRESQKTK